MFILLALALTFWAASRQEMRSATNVANGVRAELLEVGATAIAESFLQYDLMIHPSFTSLDHAWRSYFNGSWITGKDWASWDPPLQSGELPGEVARDSGKMPKVFFTEEAGYPKAAESPHLYVPRRETSWLPYPSHPESTGGYNPYPNPGYSLHAFLEDTQYSAFTREEQVDGWADVRQRRRRSEGFGLAPMAAPVFLAPRTATTPA